MNSTFDTVKYPEGLMHVFRYRVTPLAVALCTILLAASRGRAANEMMTGFWKNLSEGKNQTLAIVGTSLSFQQMGDCEGTVSYPCALRDTLERLFPGQVTVRNYAMKGVYSSYVVNKIEDAVRDGADCVILEFASNDAVNRFDCHSEACTRTNNEIAIDKIRAGNPDADIINYITALPWDKDQSCCTSLGLCGDDCGGDAWKNNTCDAFSAHLCRRGGRTHIEKYFQVMREVADNRHIHITDTYDAFASIWDEHGADLYKEYIGDGHHSSLRAAKEIIVPMLLETMRGKPYGEPLQQQPELSWSVDGGGDITDEGLFSAGAEMSFPHAITVSADGIAAQGTVHVKAYRYLRATIKEKTDHYLTAYVKEVAWKAGNTQYPQSPVPGESVFDNDPGTSSSVKRDNTPVTFTLDLGAGNGISPDSIYFLTSEESFGRWITAISSEGSVDGNTWDLLIDTSYNYYGIKTLLTGEGTFPVGLNGPSDNPTQIKPAAHALSPSKLRISFSKGAVRFSRPVPRQAISVYDLTGRCMPIKTSGRWVDAIKLDHMSAGLYTVHVSFDSYSSSVRAAIAE